MLGGYRDLATAYADPSRADSKALCAELFERANAMMMLVKELNSQDAEAEEEDEGHEM